MNIPAGDHGHRSARLGACLGLGEIPAPGERCLRRERTDARANGPQPKRVPLVVTCLHVVQLTEDRLGQDPLGIPQFIRIENAPLNRVQSGEARVVHRWRTGLSQPGQPIRPVLAAHDVADDANGPARGRQRGSHGMPRRFLAAGGFIDDRGVHVLPIEGVRRIGGRAEIKGLSRQLSRPALGDGVDERAPRPAGESTNTGRHRAGRDADRVHASAEAAESHRPRRSRPRASTAHPARRLRILGPASTHAPTPGSRGGESTTRVHLDPAKPSSTLRRLFAGASGRSRDAG